MNFMLPVGQSASPQQSAPTTFMIPGAKPEPSTNPATSDELSQPNTSEPSSDRTTPSSQDATVCSSGTFAQPPGAHKMIIEGATETIKDSLFPIPPLRAQGVIPQVLPQNYNPTEIRDGDVDLHATAPDGDSCGDNALRPPIDLPPTDPAVSVDNGQDFDMFLKHTPTSNSNDKDFFDRGASLVATALQSSLPSTKQCQVPLPVSISDPEKSANTTQVHDGGGLRVLAINAASGKNQGATSVSSCHGSEHADANGISSDSFGANVGKVPTVPFASSAINSSTTGMNSDVSWFDEIPTENDTPTTAPLGVEAAFDEFAATTVDTTGAGIIAAEFGNTSGPSHGSLIGGALRESRQTGEEMASSILQANEHLATQVLHPGGLGFTEGTDSTSRTSYIAQEDEEEFTELEL